MSKVEIFEAMERDLQQLANAAISTEMFVYGTASIADDYIKRLQQLNPPSSVDPRSADEEVQF